VLAAACVGQPFPNASFAFTSNAYIGENYIATLGPKNLTFILAVYREVYCNLFSMSLNLTCWMPAVLQINSTTLCADCEIYIYQYNMPANTSFNFYVTYSLIDITNGENILLNGPNATFYTPAVFYMFRSPKFCSGEYVLVGGQFIGTYTYAVRYIINDNFVYTTEWYSPISNGTQVNTSIPYNLTAPITFPIGTRFSVQGVMEKDLAGNVYPVIDGSYLKLPNYTIEYNCYKTNPPSNAWPWWAWFIIGVSGTLIGTVIGVTISLFWGKRFSHPSEREVLISS